MTCFTPIPSFHRVFRSPNPLVPVLLATLAALFVPALAPAQLVPKKSVASEADLPHFTYPVSGSALELLHSAPSTFNGFAAAVRADLEEIFRSYEIRDDRLMVRLLSDRLDLQMMFVEDAAALETCNRMQALFDKPDRKAMGMFNDLAFIRARMATGKSEGPVFQMEYEKLLRAQTEALPWDVVADRLRRRKAQFEQLSPNFIEGTVTSEIEPAVARDHALDFQLATRLIFWRGVLSTELPQREIVLSILNRYISAHEATRPSSPSLPPAG